MSQLLAAAPALTLAAGGLRHPIAFAAAAALLWAAWIKAAPRLDREALAPWGLWLAWATFCCLASPQPLAALPSLSRWAAVLAFFAFALSWGAAQRRLWLWVLLAAVPVLSLAAFWTGGQVLYDHGSGERMWGLLPPYYNYTMFVLATAAAAAFAALKGAEARTRQFLWAALACALLTLLAARARAALLAFLAAAAVASWRHGGGRRLRLAAAAIVALAGLVTAGVIVAREGQASAAHLLKLDKLYSFKRPQIWRAAWEAAVDRPLTGWGPGNFEQGFSRHNFRSGYGVAEYQFSTAHAHSEPLQMLAETGFAGFGLFVMAILSCFRFPARATTDYFQEASIAAWTAMTAQMLIDNMLHIPGLALLWFSALACFFPAKPQKSMRWPAWLGLGLALTAWIPREQAARSPETAVRLFPGDWRHRLELARQHLLAEPPRPEEALRQLEFVSQLNPTHALSFVQRAEILRQWGRRAEVLELASRAVGLEPNFIQARLLKAEALALEGDKKAARAELSEAERRAPELSARLSAGLLPYHGYDRAVAHLDGERLKLVKKLVR